MYRKPADRMWEMLAFGRRKLHTDFWALKDISISIPQGETVGIIGCNGSGKSTLLQLICSVLQPTKGTMKVNGRISAILELGAGFHPELSGRENVIFHGIQNGLTDREAKDRVGGIAEFADIGEFLDQPVKTYSSGMFIRLAFSAAINVDPDILIVDEALSVGDAQFQHKCYRKFHEFQKAGKTILFVTHDVNAVTRHCNRAILLDKGRISFSGSPKDVVHCYHELISTGNVECRLEPEKTTDSEKDSRDSRLAFPNVERHFQIDRFLSETSTSDQCIQRSSYNKNEHRFGNRRAEIIDYLIVSDGQVDLNTLTSCKGFDLYLKILFHDQVDQPVCGFSIKTVDGIVIYGTNSLMRRQPLKSVAKSEVLILKFSAPIPLHGGDYFINLGCEQKMAEKIVSLDRRMDAVHLIVNETIGFDGIVDMDSTIEEVGRVKPNATNTSLRIPAA